MNNPIKKGVVVSVILLFISVSIVPTTGTRVSFDDITPPVTTCTLNPPEPNGNNSWYVSDVEVTLNATDDMSGVNVTQYRINGGSIKMYTEPFNVTVDGQHTVEYRSVDNAGNVEDWKSIEFKIDQHQPPTTLTYKKKSWSQVLLKAYIKELTSGVNRVEFYLDDQLIFTDYDEPYEFLISSHPRGPCSVRGLIFYPQFSDEYVSFYAILVKMKGRLFFSACAFDNAGNLQWDILFGPYMEPYVGIFKHFTFKNNYTGKIGLLFINAEFKVGPL